MAQISEVWACELIIASEIFQFGGLRAIILTKIEVVEAKISHFCVKGGLQGHTSPHPLSRSGPGRQDTSANTSV